MHDWKAGDKVCMEGEVNDVVGNHVCVTCPDGHSRVLPAKILKPFAPDSAWREKWEEKDRRGDTVIHVDENRGYFVYMAKGMPEISMIGNMLIPKRHPAPEPKYRPWKPEEARGKWVKVRSNGNEIMLTTFNIDGRAFVSGYDWITMTSLMEVCEQLDGSVCGVRES